MVKLTAKEYQELKAFLRFFSERYFNMEGLEIKDQPVSVLERLERDRPSKAFQGLRMAVNDCLEMSNHWSHERVVQLDRELTQAGVVTLSELRVRYSRAYSRVVSRGQIKSEVEYYLIKGVREFGGCALDPADIKTLDNLLLTYETKVMPSKNIGN